MYTHYKAYIIMFTITCLVFSGYVVFAQPKENAISEIYSKLKCCSCKDKFESCSCPESIEMKGYIAALIENNTNKEEIFYKVAKKFSLNTIIDEKIRQDIEKRLIFEAGKNRPQIFLDSTFYNFGTVSKKQGKISKIFKLSNKGNAPLVIKSMKTSCPCAFASLKADRNKSPYFGTKGSPKDWQVELKSGRSAELELMLDLASSHIKIGKIVRAAIIVSNDPLYPEQIVRVEADVKE